MAMRRSRGVRSFTTFPPIRISPAVGDSRPAIIRKKRGFPGARRPQENQKLAFAGFQIYFINCSELSFFKYLGQFPGFNDGHSVLGSVSKTDPYISALASSISPPPHSTLI